MPQSNMAATWPAAWLKVPQTAKNTPIASPAAKREADTIPAHVSSPTAKNSSELKNGCAAIASDGWCAIYAQF